MGAWPGVPSGGESSHDEILARFQHGPGALRLDPDTLAADPLAAERSPGHRPVHPAGGRDVQPAAATTTRPAAERHAWVPIGPRNIAGRIRAIACADPATARTWYAASAGGGVWKTTDGGHRWHPLWRDQASLDVAALAVAPSRHQRVYAATGESRGLSLLNVRGHGIYVSDDAGVTWTNHGAGSPPGPNPAHRGGFEAVTVHPTTPDHCWAAGLDGLFRTLDGGITWDRFAAGTAFTDVALSGTRLYAVRGTSRAGEAAVLRVDAPGAAVAAVAAELAHPDAVSTVRAAVPAHLPWPVAGKIAIAPSDPDIAYVRFASEPALRGDRSDSFHLGVFRTRNARAARGRDVTWARLHGHDDWLDERQGDYNLCIAVHPTDPATVVTGMVLLHRSTNATAAAGAVRWQRIMAWPLHDEGLRAHHADQHAVVIAGSPAELWVADDGGVSRSTNFITGSGVGFSRPTAPGCVAWQERDNGISGAQFYDLGQSPLVPGVVAGGLQDNGTHLRVGGLTWRMVFGGDGAFAAFDPDDPYRLLISYYGGLYALQYPALLDRLFADLGHDPGPGTVRQLRHGITDDRPPFVPETARHPTRTGRLLHARVGRLYGTRDTTGERLVAEELGRSFELRITSSAASLEVSVDDTPAAMALGLWPGTWRRTAQNGPPGRPLVLTLASHLAAPYRLTDASPLRLTVDGVVHEVPLVALGLPRDGATLSDVVRVLRASALPPARVSVLPLIWDTPTVVQISTRATGAGVRLELGGTALDPQPDGLSRLGANRGTYRGDVGRPASAYLGFVGYTDAQRQVNRDLSAPSGQVLTVAVDGGPVRGVTIEPPAFPDPAHITAGELAAALAVSLGADPDPARAVDVVATPAVVAAELRAGEGRRVVLTGTAADRFGAPAPGATRVPLGIGSMAARHRGTAVRHRGCVDLRPDGPDPLELVISDGTTRTGRLLFTAPAVADLAAVPAADLQRVLSAHLAAHPAVDVRVEPLVLPLPGFATALAFSARAPQEAWAGTVDGGLFVTRDDGATWQEVGDPLWRRSDRQVESIALHPTERTVYVGLSGEAHVPEDPGFLFRSAGGAAPWRCIGHTVTAGRATGIADDGVPLGVTAIDLDPGDPSVVLVGTVAGVFRSVDGGGTWAPAGEGLPNTPVVDVVTDAATRVARVASWTRGAYERRLDDGPPSDARLLIRAGELDDGRRPARIAPALGATVPGAAELASPDIKVVRRRPAVGTDAELDGVVFDLDVPHDDVVAGETCEVIVQVTNIGTLPVPTTSPPPAADRVRVVLLHAPADRWPPPLPADLASLVAAASLPGAMGGWTTAGEATVARAVGPGDTACATVAVTWPALDGCATLGLLAIASAPADPFTGDHPTVAALLAADAHAAYREVPVRTPEEDRTLVVTATHDGDVTVAQPPAEPGITGVAERLGFAAATLGTSAPVHRAATAAGPTYDLSGTGPALVLSSSPLVADVTLDAARAEGVRRPAAVSAREAAEILRVAVTRAGVPLDAFAFPVGVTLRCTGGARVRVTGGAAAAALGWSAMAPGAAVTELASDRQPVRWFDLSAGSALHLEVRAPGAAVPVTVSFAAEHFSSVTAADPRAVATLVNIALAEHGLGALVECTVDEGVLATGSGDALITLSGPGAARLGLAGGPATWLPAAPGPVDLTGGLAVHVELTPRVTVRFDGDPADIPDRAAAHPADVRRAVNLACEIARVPVRAEVPSVSLRVAASPADRGRRHPVTGGAELGELVARRAPVAEADRPALFAARSAPGRDTLASGSTNHLYLRVVNDGNVPARARLRLFRVDMAGAGVPTAVVASAAHDVGRRAQHVAEFTWDPGGAPRTETLMAVADRDLDGARVDPPAGGFLTPAGASAFAEQHRGVALRTFTVVAP